MHSTTARYSMSLALPASLTAAILAASAALYLSSVSTARFGLYHDDAIYAVTASSLASGNGYRIISLPHAPPQTKYPPFYPYVLSVVWRIWPHFPENLTLMLYLSAGLTVLFHIVTWRYFRSRQYTSPWRCVLVLSLLSFNFRELVLATSLLSEPLFALLSIVSLWLAESYSQSRRRILGMLLSVSLMLCVLTRLAGTAILIAVFIHLKHQKRLKDNLLIVILPGVVLCLWLAWCRAAASWDGGCQLPYYTSYFHDWVQVLSDEAHRIGHSVMTTSLILLLKNLVMSLVASTSVVILGFSYRELPTLWGFPAGLFGIAICFSLILTGFCKEHRSHPGIVHTYVVAYVLLHAVWPYTAYDRFLMPILPFLLLYLTNPFVRPERILRERPGLVLSRHRIASPAIVVGVLLAGALFVAYNHAVGVRRQLDQTRKQEAQSATCDTPLFAWLVAHTKPDEVLMCYQDAKCYLFTGRKTVRTPFRFGAKEPERALGDSMRFCRADYLILRPDDFALENRPESMRDALRSYLQSRPDEFVEISAHDGCDAAVYRTFARR